MRQQLQSSAPVPCRASREGNLTSYRWSTQQGWPATLFAACVTNKCGRPECCNVGTAGCGCPEDSALNVLGTAQHPLALANVFRQLPMPICCFLSGCDGGMLPVPFLVRLQAPIPFETFLRKAAKELLYTEIPNGAASAGNSHRGTCGADSCRQSLIRTGFTDATQGASIHTVAHLRDCCILFLHKGR